MAAVFPHCEAMFERATKLEKVFRRHPETPVFARLAEQALRKGRLMRAQVLCEEGCERFPDYPTGHVILGRVYETQGLWEEARTAFDQGLRLDPDQPAVYRRLSRIYSELGNPTLALKCMESAAHLDPLSDSVSAQLRRLADQTRATSMASVSTEPIATESRSLPPPTENPAPPRAGDGPVPEPERGPATDPSADIPVVVGHGVMDPTEPESPTEEQNSEEPGHLTSSNEPQVPSSPFDAAPSEPAPDSGLANQDEPAAEPFSAVQPLPEWDTPEPNGREASDEDTDQEEATVAEAVVESPAPDAGGPGPGTVEAWPEEETDGIQIDEVEADEVEVGAPDSGVSATTKVVEHEQEIPDSSEVAALGEGLFEESEEEVEEVRPTKAPVPKRPASSTKSSQVAGASAPEPSKAPPRSPGVPPSSPQAPPAKVAGSQPEARQVQDGPPALETVPSDDSRALGEAAGLSIPEGPDGSPVDPDEVADGPDAVVARGEAQTESVVATDDIADANLGDPGPEGSKFSGAEMVDEAPTAGFALRADDGLRDLVAQIQGADEKELKTAEEEDPLPFATVTLAKLYNRQGFGDRAAQIYQQILAVDPSNEAARAGLESLNTAS